MTDELAPTESGQAFATLASETGCAADLAGQHGRWELYEAAFGSVDLLSAALADEPATALS